LFLGSPQINDLSLLMFAQPEHFLLSLYICMRLSWSK
jgi:hypothetical protein